MTTPQWLVECPLHLIPPIDEKTVYIGDSIEPIKLPGHPLFVIDKFSFDEVFSDNKIVPVYVEVDKCFKNETQVLLN